MGNAFESFGAALLWTLVGFPSLFAAFLVDVIGKVGSEPVGQPLGGDPLIDGVGMTHATVFGQVRCPVAGVGQEFVNAVLDSGGGHLWAPVALWAYLTSAG